MVNDLKNKMRSENMEHDAQSGINIVNEIMKRGRLRSAARFIFAVDINSAPILADLFDPFFFFPRASH